MSKETKLKWTKVNDKYKVAKWSGKSDADIRTYRLKGYNITAQLLDVDPRTGKRMRSSQWFVFASKK